LALTPPPAARRENLQDVGGFGEEHPLVRCFPPKSFGKLGEEEKEVGRVRRCVPVCRCAGVQGYGRALQRRPLPGPRCMRTTGTDAQQPVVVQSAVAEAGACGLLTLAHSTVQVQLMWGLRDSLPHTLTVLQLCHDRCGSWG
jgi:hypothetical protein